MDDSIARAGSSLTGPDAPKVGERLKAIAEEHVRWRRGRYEERWLADIAQYSALQEQSPDDLQKKDKGKGAGASITLSLTARYCNLAMSRIGDLLFPGDGAKNWGVEATPVPELSDTITDATPASEVAGMPIEDEPSIGDLSHEMIEEARKRAKAMEREISDQFSECNYPKKARLAIRDAAIYGTGVLKGPAIPIKPSRKWVPLDGGKPWQRILELGPNSTPGVEWVDLWDFYPDMSAISIEDARFVFERRFLTRERLMAIKHLPGAVTKAIDAVADTPVREYYITEELREWYRGGTLSTYETRSESRYPMFCYTGPERPEDVRSLFHDEDESKRPPIPEGAGINFQIWFIGSTIVRANILPMDTGDFGYSVFPWEPDPANLFGFGVPYRVRHTQKMANGAFRELANNTGVTSQPQVVLKEAAVEAADGDNRIRSGKVWYVNDMSYNVSDAFAVFDIPSHAGEFMNIINMCEQFMSMEAMQPPLSSGEGPVQSHTAQGTAILSNNASANVRRLVRQWDDHITMTMVPRFWDWNMQMSEDPNIKGDEQGCVPKGVSVLLQRELQAHNLMTLAMSMSEHAVYGKHFKEREILDQILQAHHINAEDLLKSPDTVSREEQERAEAEAAQPPEPNPEMLKIESDAAFQQQKMAQTMEQFLARQEHENQKLALEYEKLKTQLDIAFAKLSADAGAGALKEQSRMAADEARNKTELAKTLLKERGQAERDQVEIVAEQPNPRVM